MWINVRCDVMNDQGQSIWDHYRQVAAPGRSVVNLRSATGWCRTG